MPCTTPTPVSLFSAQSIFAQYVYNTETSPHTVSPRLIRHWHVYTDLHILPAHRLNHLDAHHPIERALPLSGHGPVVHEVHAHAVREARVGGAPPRERGLLRRERERVDGRARDRGRDEEGHRAPAGADLEDLRGGVCVSISVGIQASGREGKENGLVGVCAPCDLGGYPPYG